MRATSFILAALLAFNTIHAPICLTQEPVPSKSEVRPEVRPEVFEKVEMFVVNGQKTKQIPVRLRLDGKSLVIESRQKAEILKSFDYADLKSAEYSYSKHPRWKAGAGAAAVGYLALGSLIFWPLFPIALPASIALGKSKSKRHWLTVKSDTDYVVLRLDKNIRKVILPAFEVRSGIKVEATGEDK